MKKTSLNTCVRAFKADHVSEAAGNYKNTTVAKIAKYTLMVLTCGVGYGVVKLLESHYNIKPKIHEFCARANVIFNALDQNKIKGNKSITVSLPGNVSITLEEIDGGKIVKGYGVLLKIGEQESFCANQTFESIRKKILQDSIDNPGLYGSQFVGVDKLIEVEDKMAHDILKKPGTELWVKDLANKIYGYLLDHCQNNIEQKKFIQDYIILFNRTKFFCPVPKVVDSIKTFNGLLSVLRSDHPPAVKIGLMWVAMLHEFSESDKIVSFKLGALYDEKIFPLIVKPISGKKARHKDNYFYRFGNGDSIKTDMFSIKYFYSYARKIDLVDFNDVSNLTIIKEMSKSNDICISGVSPLAIYFCFILEKLKILPSSKDGKTFIEIMSAFIAGSGMSSFVEALSTFELYKISMQQNIGNDAVL